MEELLSVWTSPRATLSRMQGRRLNPWLSFVIVWAWGAAFAIDRSMGDPRLARLSFEGCLAFLIGIGVIGGYIYFYTLGFAIDCTNSWFGGRAANEEIRKALVLGSLPKAVSLVAYLTLLAVFGVDYFTNSDLPDGYPTIAVTLFYLLTCAAIALSVWSAFTMSKALAEVQGYESAWRAFFHIVVAYLLVILAIAVPLIVVALMFRAI